MEDHIGYKEMNVGITTAKEIKNKKVKQKLKC